MKQLSFLHHLNYHGNSLPGSDKKTYFYWRKRSLSVCVCITIRFLNSLFRARHLQNIHAFKRGCWDYLEDDERLPQWPMGLHKSSSPFRSWQHSLAGNHWELILAKKCNLLMNGVQTKAGRVMLADPQTSCTAAKAKAQSVQTSCMCRKVTRPIIEENYGVKWRYLCNFLKFYVISKHLLHQCNLPLSVVAAGQYVGDLSNYLPH